MADEESDTRGDIPGDLDGQIALCRELGTPDSLIAAEVYEEARDGKLPLDEVRDEVLARQLGAV